MDRTPPPSTNAAPGDADIKKFHTMMISNKISFLVIFSPQIVFAKAQHIQGRTFQVQIFDDAQQASASHFSLLPNEDIPWNAKSEKAWWC